MVRPYEIDLILTQGPIAERIRTGSEREVTVRRFRPVI
jgi:hypothetical protein